MLSQMQKLTELAKNNFIILTLSYVPINKIMVICDRCQFRETIDIKAFITVLLQKDDRYLYCQQCKQILTTIYVSGLFDKLLHFDKTDLDTLFDIATKLGFQNKTLQGSGPKQNNKRFIISKLKNLPNKEYDEMVQKVQYKDCIDYMKILSDLIVSDADNKQNQQQVFKNDYEQIKSFITGLYTPNQQNELKLVGFDRDPVVDDFSSLGNKEYKNDIAEYSTKFRERFTAYIRYQKISNIDNTNIQILNEDGTTKDVKITDNDRKLVYQIFLIIAAIYNWCDQNRNRRPSKIENVSITDDIQITIQLIQHRDDYNEYKIEIDQNIGDLNEYLKSIYILFDDTFNIKGYSLLHGILYIMAEQSPDIKVDNMVNNIQSLYSSQLSTLFKLTYLTYNAYQNFGQHYISFGNKAYEFVEFYKLFQQIIYDRYNLIEYTLVDLQKKVFKKQIIFDKFEANFAFVRNKNKTEILTLESLKSVYGVSGISENIKVTINRLITYFSIQISNTEKQFSSLYEIYVVLLMTVNYLLMYDQINENNREINENDKENNSTVRGINYLHDTQFLSQTHIQTYINNDKTKINQINIFCILYYIALKIYLDEIIEKKLQVDDLTKAFIDLAYQKLIDNISVLTKADNNRKQIYQDYPYELLADVIIYIIQQFGPRKI